MSKEVWTFLSFPLNLRTQAYGNGPGLSIEIDRSIECGHSSNSIKLHFSNHLGTHVDAPRHFFDNGKAIDQYSAENWIFSKVVILDVPTSAGGMVGVDDIKGLLSEINDADLVFFRTGFEAKRGTASYWSESPGFSADLCNYLKDRLPSLGAIGMDTISISSMKHREMGREAHRAFLGAGLRIFEDISLRSIKSISLVCAAPLLIEGGDGAPCTLIALLPHK